MSDAQLSDEQVRDLAGVLLATRPDELTCDEWLDRIGAYAEATAAGRPVPPNSERLEHHLAICPECREEFDALVAALRTG
jgi:hypothetical protein